MGTTTQRRPALDTRTYVIRVWTCDGFMAELRRVDEETPRLFYDATALARHLDTEAAATGAGAASAGNDSFEGRSSMVLESDTRQLPLRVDIEAFHHAATGSVSYLVVDANAGCGAVIDCMLGFDTQTGVTDDSCVRHWVERLQRRRLRLEWILETHVHADRLSGAFALKQAAGGRIGIGAGVLDVARLWQRAFEATAAEDVATGFDRLLADGDILRVGTMQLGVMATPGHTPACVTYLIADAGFVGDTLFMPPAGTARCDFPGGSARTLYRSTRRILALPPTTRLFCAHDYGSGTGDVAQWESTVAQQRRDNLHAHARVSEEEFVALREQRDRGLAPPALLYTALQFNLSGGRSLVGPPRTGTG